MLRLLNTNDYDLINTNKATIVEDITIRTKKITAEEILYTTNITYKVCIAFVNIILSDKYDSCGLSYGGNSIIENSNGYRNTNFLTYFICNKDIMTSYYRNETNSNVVSIALKTNENIVAYNNTDSQVTYKIYCYYIN